MRRIAERVRDERGVAAIIAVITLSLVFTMATIVLDSGSIWTTRQSLVTANHAAALAAARAFEQGAVDPCDPDEYDEAEAEAFTVLRANDSEARHSATDTPDGFEVALTNALDCLAPNGDLPTGHVRFDARLEAQAIFAHLLGVATLDTFASTTVQWGYITSLDGLRPIAICDQTNPPRPVYGTTTAPFPHFALWNWLRHGDITQDQYDAYFDRLHSPQHPAVEYPTTSWRGTQYLAPSEGGGVVHYVYARDNCGGPSNWRGWLDFTGQDGASDVAEWLENGYPGWISLTPKQCTPGAPNGWCGNKPGNNNGVQDAMDGLRCPETTPTKDCFAFPVALFDGVSGQGRNTWIHETAFVFVVLRDHRNCESNDGCEFHVEFVKVQAQGGIGRNPSGEVYTATGTQLCGVDHDAVANRCDV